MKAYDANSHTVSRHHPKGKLFSSERKLTICDDTTTQLTVDRLSEIYNAYRSQDDVYQISFSSYEISEIYFATNTFKTTMPSNFSIHIAKNISSFVRKNEYMRRGEKYDTQFRAHYM